MTKARDLANGGFGLVLVKPSSVVNGTDNGKGTVSFSAASAVSLNDVFSSTYTNYVIMLNVSTHSAADKTVNMRLRVSNADNSTSNYFERFVGFTEANAADNFRNNNATVFFICPLNNGTDGYYSSKIEVYDPFLSVPTKTTTHINGVIGATNTVATNIGGGLFGGATSFTGFTLSASTGDFTGSVSVYGINK
jgi:hypothetical protein